MSGEERDGRRSSIRKGGECRFDELTGETVLVSPSRSERPNALATPGGPVGAEIDPFLEGNEEQTPPETFAIRPDGSPPNGPGWLVRVVPNQYPVVGPDAANDESVGRHEVVVECPHFERRFTALDATQVRRVLEAYRSRLAAFRGECGRGYGLVFKNSGPLAGATVEHVHSQVLVTRFVPRRVQAALATAREYFDEHGRDLGGACLERELRSAERVVVTSEAWAAYCPAAGRFPFECRLVPRERHVRPESTPDVVLDDLAETLLRVLRALEAVHDRVDYNLVLHTLPFEEPDDVQWFRWWIEVIPRLASLGGFEFGGGTYINPVSPTRAAEALRDAIASR